MMRHLKIILSLTCLATTHAGAVAPPEPPTRATAAAAMLADADAAASSDTPDARRTLIQTLAEIDRLGVRGLDDDSALATWRARAGDAAAPVTRGRVLGPAFRHGWLAPGQAIQVQQVFTGGEPAAIAVASVPRDPGGVMLSIADAPATCGGAMRQCRWLPLFTQRYTITVQNPTAIGVRFYLVMD